MKLARAANTGYTTITALSSQTVFTCESLDADVPNNYYLGCKVLIRPANWISEMKTVTGSTGNTLTIDSACTSLSEYILLKVNQGIIVMNKLEFIDSAGEWFYDTATDTVYLWTPNGDTPANYEVRGSVIDDGIQLTAKSYVTVQDINILHQKQRGIDVSGSGSISNVSLLRNTISGQELYGIYCEPTTGQALNFSSNILNDCNAAAIFCFNVGNSTFSRNTISKITSI